MNTLLNKKLLLSAVFTISALVFASAVNAQGNSNSGPMVPRNATVKISDHVYVIPDNNIPGVPNVGIIVGSQSTLVIDTGMGHANGMIVLEEARKVSGNNQLYLVTTHVHPEHDLGAHAFPDDTKMIRSVTQVAEIAEVGLRTADAFRSRSAAIKELLEGAEFREADIEFESEYKLDLGGVNVHLFAVGPNHTPGDTVTLVVEDKVMFSGDVAMQALPAFASPKSSLTHWLASLDQLYAMQANIVVPSHGPMGGAELIEGYQNFLTSVRDKTQKMKSEGLSLDEVTEKLSQEFEEQYSSSRRIAGAIRNAYAEAK
ncbi:MBL fold metallo-hydrolase [Aurantivibrio infirmus]